MADPITSLYGMIIAYFAGPGEAAATRMGLTGGQDRNAFIHTYTAAMLTYKGFPTFMNATNTADFLGRLKENIPLGFPAASVILK